MVSTLRNNYHYDLTEGRLPCRWYRSWRHATALFPLQRIETRFLVSPVSNL